MTATIATTAMPVTTAEWVTALARIGILRKTPDLSRKKWELTEKGAALMPELAPVETDPRSCSKCAHCVPCRGGVYQGPTTAMCHAPRVVNTVTSAIYCIHARRGMCGADGRLFVEREA